MRAIQEAFDKSKEAEKELQKALGAFAPVGAGLMVKMSCRQVIATRGTVIAHGPGPYFRVRLEETAKKSVKSIFFGDVTGFA